jgi:hypothetical protein
MAMIPRQEGDKVVRGPRQDPFTQALLAQRGEQQSNRLLEAMRQAGATQRTSAQLRSEEVQQASRLETQERMQVAELKAREADREHQIELEGRRDKSAKDFWTMRKSFYEKVAKKDEESQDKYYNRVMRAKRFDTIREAAEKAGAIGVMAALTKRATKTREAREEATRQTKKSSARATEKLNLGSKLRESYSNSIKLSTLGTTDIEGLSTEQYESMLLTEARRQLNDSTIGRDLLFGENPGELKAKLFTGKYSVEDIAKVQIWLDEALKFTQGKLEGIVSEKEEHEIPELKRPTGLAYVGAFFGSDEWLKKQLLIRSKAGIREKKLAGGIETLTRANEILERGIIEMGQLKHEKMVVPDKNESIRDMMVRANQYIEEVPPNYADIFPAEPSPDLDSVINMAQSKYQSYTDALNRFPTEEAPEDEWRAYEETLTPILQSEKQMTEGLIEALGE